MEPVRSLHTLISLYFPETEALFPKGFPICRCTVSRRGRECSSGGLHIPLPVSAEEEGSAEEGKSAEMDR